jgi:hypothetical protein
MSAPVGNQNARKRNRMLTDALKRELTQNPEDVTKIVRKLIDRAIEGDSWAQALIHERVDGKVPQAIVGDDEEAPIRLVNRVELVDLGTGSDPAEA